MKKTVRTFLYLVCAFQVLMAIALFLQWPAVTDLWPFAGTTPLTFIFLSSILAAAAASTFWAAASGAYGALAGIGLDYVAIMTPLAVLSFQLGAASGAAAITMMGVLSVIGALFGFGLVLWSIRLPLAKTPKMPTLVRGSFIAFIIALLVVSVRLILKTPNVIPWSITPDLSLIIGWMFVGAAVYFVYGVVRPSWQNAAGQLAGFLAYDLVLIVPFLARLGSVPPEHKLALVVYTIVVTYSGLLAAYYLFVHRPTRLWGHGSSAAP
jgi:hypothetical protein